MEKYFLNKWNDFISRWAEALKGYDTPHTFVERSSIKHFQLEFNEGKYPFIEMDTPGYAKRAELMKKQKKEAEKRKNLPARWENDGNIACFLCDNVGQASAAKENENIPNNMMYDLGDYFVLPNKYAALIGHSLFVPKKHDDETKRIIPIEEIYNLEHGKTRGAIFTKNYLEELVKFCDSFHLCGISNHVLDGMSIPGHKHWHLYPEDLNLFSLTPNIRENMKRAHYKGIYTPQNTPFDMLIIKKNSKSFFEQSTQILENLEKDNQIFTLLYDSGHLTISPRKNSEKVTQRLKIGGGLPFHLLVDKSNIKEIKEFVPVKGEYNWKKYI